MSVRLSIRPAIMEDIETLARLRRESLDQDTPEGRALRSQGGEDTKRIEDGCVLAARTGGQCVASATLDIDACEIAEVIVAPTFQRMGIGSRMVEEIERLAVRFGILRLGAHVPEPASIFFERCRYRPRVAVGVRTDPESGIPILAMGRAFPRRQTRFGGRVRTVMQRLGIPLDYGRRHRLTLQEECRELASVGHDVFDREQWLSPDAADAWHRLRHAADEDGVEIGIASAFRTVEYQAELVERKQASGQSLDEILAVSAAPGFSEHHTGRAIDVATPESKPLDTEFENTAAFEWLMDAAHRFGFRLSYPRNNRHGIAYEPWHWKWHG